MLGKMNLRHTMQKLGNMAKKNKSFKFTFTK